MREVQRKGIIKNSIIKNNYKRQRTMKFSQGLGVILGTTTLALVQYQSVSALTPLQVNDIAKQITVMIGGLDGKGSGVIIDKNGNTYTVLTANHVVNKAGYGLYEIITHDGQKYQMENKAQTLGKLDLALVKFTSSKNYPIAKIADSQTVKEGATVYNSGFPIPSSSNNQQRIYFFITAQITARGRGENLGYDLFLSGGPRPGMSGGPILNDQGEVIGIYGKAEFGRSESALARDGVQGIPTEKFPNLISNIQNQQVNDIAKPITVMIGRLNYRLYGVWASGVIIAKNGNTYTVLTANHVVEDAGDDIYEIITHDGQKYPMESAQTLGKLDLALVRFTSSKNYPLAKIGDSRTVKEGSTVYRAGFGYVNANKSPNYCFIRADITGRSQDQKGYGYEFNYCFIRADITGRSQDQEGYGYKLSYNGATVMGMSGGPVLNEQGFVIAIHGMRDIKIIKIQGVERTETVGLRGIPTEKFSNVISIIQNNIQDNTQANTPRNNPSPRTESTPVTFEKLEGLLKAGKWQDADEETWELMLKLTKREREGWLRLEDVKNFPRQELRKIDQLWVKYSNGKFGFSVQKQIWLDLGGKLDGKPDGDTYVYVKLGYSVGWRKNNDWLLYKDYTFSTNAPKGHLPVNLGGNSPRGGILGWYYSFLFSRL